MSRVPPLVEVHDSERLSGTVLSELLRIPAGAAAQNRGNCAINDITVAAPLIAALFLVPGSGMWGLTLSGAAWIGTDHLIQLGLRGPASAETLSGLGSRPAPRQGQRP